MALQSINVGQFVNDGTGDDLRTAFIKINANFEEIDLQGGQANTITNIGAGRAIYKEKIGVDLKLRSLVAGPGITIDQNANDLTISNNRNMIVTVNANTGSLTASSPTQALNIIGGTGVTTTLVGNTLTITGSSQYSLDQDSSPSLAGNLDLNGFNIIGGTGTNITAEHFNGGLTGNVTGNVTGNLTGLVYGLDVRNINNTLTSYDFGPIIGNVPNIISFLLSNIDFDMGGFSNPNPIGVDLGSF